MNQQRQLACLIPNLQKATRKGDASEELGAHSGHVPFVNAPQSADTAISLPNARTFFFSIILCRPERSRKNEDISAEPGLLILRHRDFLSEHFSALSLPS